ncbi:YckD family protein [bacterium]|nr:YckD family protein [bacterium]
MKLLKRIFLITLVVASIGFSSMAIAHGWGRGYGGGQMGYNQQTGTAGPGRILGNEMYQARIDILAELTGQSGETIKAKLLNKPMWAVLDEYKVDFATFQSKMHEKVLLVVKKAAEEGKITQEQADLMTQRMSDGPGQGFSGRGRGRGYGGNCPWN